MANKALQTVQLFGQEIPRYKDCDRCGKTLACSWGTFGYIQPCNDCRNTDEWQMEQEKKEKLRDTIGEVYKNKEAVAVWEFKGRQLFTNHRGDIIKDEAYKPRPRGIVEKRKEYC